MKKLLLSFLFAAGWIALFGQVETGDHSMSEGVQSALFVELPGADKKMAEKIWRSYAKSFGKVENNRKAKEIMLMEAVVPAIDVEGPLTVYTKFDEYDKMTRAFFWLKSGDEFITDMGNSEAISGATVFINEYTLQVEKEVIKEELEEEEKVLKNLQKDLEKLEKKNKDLYKDIEKAKEAIRRAESDIERNLQDQENKKKEIDEQRKVISKVSDKMNNVGKA